MRTSKVSFLNLLVALWASITFGLFGLLLWHEKSGALPVVFTDETDLPYANLTSVSLQHASELQVELYIHPECPCTRTTLKLVERLLSELPVQPRLTIYVASYEHNDVDWKSSKNERLVANLKQATVLEDKEAARAKSKGASVSGTLVIENELEHRMFIGGITFGRGCDNLNSNYFAVRNLLSNGQIEVENTMVYGCPL